MPCFNHARFLNDSVKSVLGQTAGDLELIVVDDCSTDKSWEMISKLARTDSKVKAIRHVTNQGASKSRNDAMKSANGEFIAFCDADDIWEVEKLESQIKLLQENRRYDFVYSDARIIDSQGSTNGRKFSDLFPPPSQPSGNLFKYLIARNFINIQSVLMRRRCLEEIGYFDEGIKWVEDWWYWIRASTAHEFAYDNRSLARYRLHAQSTNVVQRRGYFANRFKVGKRILNEYPRLTTLERAQISFVMGVNLCELGKYNVGKRLLWQSVKFSRTHRSGVNTVCRAMGRLARYTLRALRRKRTR